MLRFLLSGCSFSSIRSAKMSILAESIVLLGCVIAFLGFVGWVGTHDTIGEEAGQAEYTSSSWFLRGYLMVLTGLALYFLNGLIQAGHRSRRRRRRTPQAPVPEIPLEITPRRSTSSRPRPTVGIRPTIP